jgi:hypothetical protein
MPNDPISPLPFIAGAAVLTNACAIMQSNATTRYNLAIAQWREFCTSLTSPDSALPRQYADPHAAVALAQRRVRLQLDGLGLLNGAVALFAATTVLGLVGVFLVQTGHLSPATVSLVMVTAAGGAFLLLLASMGTFFLEGACARALIGLRRHVGHDAERRHGGVGNDVS